MREMNRDHKQRTQPKGQRINQIALVVNRHQQHEHEAKQKQKARPGGEDEQATLIERNGSRRRQTAAQPTGLPLCERSSHEIKPSG